MTLIPAGVGGQTVRVGLHLPLGDKTVQHPFDSPETPPASFGEIVVHPDPQTMKRARKWWIFCLSSAISIAVLLYTSPINWDNLGESRGMGSAADQLLELIVVSIEILVLLVANALLVLIRVNRAILLIICTLTTCLFAIVLNQSLPFIAQVVLWLMI